MNKDRTPPAPALWPALRQAAEQLKTQETLLAPLLDRVILDAMSLPEAMSRLLAGKLRDDYVSEADFRGLFTELCLARPEWITQITRDIDTTMRNDPAADDALTPFLFFKGFHALQSYRLANFLWKTGRETLARFVQNRVSDLFGVDIHPAARIGCGIMMDHATGIVIGETAVVEDDVLFWHAVTLGGRDSEKTDRHPKVRKGVILGANSTLLGNIDIGAGAKIAAGSVVVHDVAAGDTVAGPLAQKKQS